MSEIYLVSIIIPTYNRAHLIGDTLDSVLAQSYHNWECIVVDDGSSDNTDEVISLYVEQDTRFRYFKRPKDRLPGGNAARNYGFELSKGEYIQWFDSDDIMYTTYLRDRLELFLKFKNIDIAYCAFTYFDKNGLQNRVSNSEFQRNPLQAILKKKINYSPPSFLIKRRIANSVKFDETLTRAQDLDFFFKIFSNHNIVLQHTNKVLFKVRKHPMAISGKEDKKGHKLNSRYIVNYRILNFYSNKNNNQAIKHFKQKCLLDLKRLLENKNYKLTLNHIVVSDYLSRKEKLLLIISIISHYLFGRGAQQFKKFTL